jgi:hypothetical protein
MYYAYRFVFRTVEEFTDSTPMPLSVVTLPEPEMKTLKDRFDEFKKAVDHGRAATLTLTQDEINALINSDPHMHGRAFVAIEGGKVKGQISIPFDFPRLGRRYVNGMAVCRVGLKDGELTVFIDELEVKGKPVPEHLLAQVRSKNLAEDVYKNPDNARVLRKLKRIEVKDGTITIESRPSRSEDGEPEADRGWPSDPFARDVVPVSTN